MARADTQEFLASHRYARISARKARLVMNLIRGEPVESALTKLRFCQRRASPMISKVVRSAVANALQEAGVEPENLIVSRAFVDEGPTMKRWRPRAQGRAYPRLRRTSHLCVVLKPTSASAPDRSPRGAGAALAGKEKDGA